MRKALVAVTVMGLVAGFATAANATEIKVGGKITTTIASDNGTAYDTSVEAKVKVDAKVDENITATVKFLADDNVNNFTVDGAYVKVKNLFNVPALCASVGYQDIVIGDSKIVDQTVDSVLLGYNTDFGKLVVGTADGEIIGGNFVSRGSSTTWAVADFKGDLKPFGIGGAFEIADLYQDAMGYNVFYGKVAPEFEMDFGKVGVSAEGAVDENGNFFGVGASLDAGMYAVGVSYDMYSDGFASPFEDYDYAEYLDNTDFTNPAIITVKAGVKPTDKVELSAAYVNFDGDSASEDEIDLKASYKYTDNLKLSAGLYLPSTGVDYSAEAEIALSF